MWNIIKEYRHYILAFFLATIPLLALNAGGKKPGQFYWFDKVALSLSAPMQQLVSWTIDTSWETWQNYIFLLHAKQDNLELSQENRKLLNELANFREVALENERLKKLVDFSAIVLGQKITARVIARDVSPEFRTIRLDKGSKHGITKNMAVITHEGIVGRILRVTRTYADVLTLLDNSSAIDALIQRTRARGIIEGQGENTLRMIYLRRTDDIVTGDVAISSGIGGYFPKGLTIGTVTNVSKKNYGITQNVEIIPSVDFSKLEEVVVIKPEQTPIAVEKLIEK